MPLSHKSTHTSKETSHLKDDTFSRMAKEPLKNCRPRLLESELVCLCDESQMFTFPRIPEDLGSLLTAGVLVRREQLTTIKMRDQWEMLICRYITSDSLLSLFMKNLCYYNPFLPRKRASLPLNTTC